MARVNRKDKFYGSVVEVLSNFRYKELANYFYVIGLCNHYGADIFERVNIKPYMKEIRTLIDNFEIERKINYKKFRTGVIEAIEKYTKKESHLKLIQLGVELFNIKDSDEALEIGNRIFQVEAIRVGD
jgi:hypothetical protein